MHRIKVSAQDKSKVVWQDIWQLKETIDHHKYILVVTAIVRLSNDLYKIKVQIRDERPQSNENAFIIKSPSQTV